MATASKGTVFKRSAVAVSDITGLSWSGMRRDVTEDTTLDDSWRTYVGIYRDAGEITLEMNFVYATYASLLTDFNSDTAVSYQIVAADAGNTTWSFSGLVTSMPAQFMRDEQVRVSVTIKISGQMTVTP
jgi:hypothetical protein